MNDRARAIAEYNRHVDEVKAALPPERLLVFTVDQGWEPLCRFLDVPMPEGAFPNVNDRAQIKQTLAGMTRGAYAILASAAVILAAALYGAWRLLG
jgi:hypothetical protein